MQRKIIEESIQNIVFLELMFKNSSLTKVVVDFKSATFVLARRRWLCISLDDVEHLKVMQATYAFSMV